MDTAIQELHSALTALRAELDAAKSELKELRDAVQIYEEDGHRHVLIECTDLVLRPHDDPRMIAVRMGTIDAKGYLNIMDWTGEPQRRDFHTAIEVAVEAEGRPVLRLRGSDHKSRAELSLDANDCGVAAVFSPGHQPGACMKANAGGGSVAVLQSDGKPRAIMMHHAEDSGGGSSQFLLVRRDGGGAFKARSDDGSAVVCLGTPAEPAAVNLAARDDSSGLIVHGPGRGTNAAILVHRDLARMHVFCGEHPGAAADASLTVSAESASVLLTRPDATRGCEIHAFREFNGFILKDSAGGDTGEFAFYDDKHTALTLRCAAAHNCFEALATKEISSCTLTSPQDMTTRILSVAKNNTTSLGILQRGRATVQISQDENGGFVSAAGLTGTSGNALMRGGAFAGAFVVGTGDGTALLGIGATDHGGQLVMNNDLGFQRIFMGVHAESSTLHFNHTGSPGIQVTAGPNGGVISVHDSEGRVRQVIDAEDDDD